MIDYDDDEDGSDLRTDATYYARVDAEFPRETRTGLYRRRIVDGYKCDEAFTRNGRWESTSCFATQESGWTHGEGEHVEITHDEAKRIIERILSQGNA